MSCHLLYSIEKLRLDYQERPIFFSLPRLLAPAGTFVVLVPVSDRETRKSTAIFMYVYTASPLARIISQILTKKSGGF